MVNITVLRENRIRFVNKRSEVIDMASLFSYLVIPEKWANMPKLIEI